MKLPRMTLRRWMLAMALIGLNLAGAIATSRYYPRPRLPMPMGYGSRGGGYISYKSDGRIEYGEVNDETGAYRLVRVGRSWPRPTLLRIFLPVIASVAISLLALCATWRRMPVPQMTTRRLMIVGPVMAIVIWLILPLIQIASHPEGDYHDHSRVDGIVHDNPFWPRYWRLLLGRPWPGDYICPFPPRIQPSMLRP